MARNAMMARVAVMAAAAVVVVAMSAGSAEARRASVASASGDLGGLSLWGRLADNGGRFTPIKVYGKAGWGEFRIRAAKAQVARIRLSEPLQYRVRR